MIMNMFDLLQTVDTNLYGIPWENIDPNPSHRWPMAALRHNGRYGPCLRINQQNGANCHLCYGVTGYGTSSPYL